jgi:uncharacterized membrane protein
MLNKGVPKTLYMSLLTIVTLLSISFNILAVRGSVMVTGKIVDVDGKSLESVEVRVYSGGSLVTRTYSSSNGVFSLNLESGMYEIQLEKRGYEARSMIVSIPFSGYKDIGLIVLDYSLKFTISLTSLRVKSMAEVSIPVTICNKGFQDELVEIQVETPEGWEAGVYSGSAQIWGLRLTQNEIQNLVMKIRVPFNASGQYELKARALGSTKQENTVSIYVEKAEPQILVSNYLTAQGLGGSTVTFELTIRNPLTKRFTAQISVMTPSSWVGSIVREDGRRLYDVSLDAGESLRALLKISVPENAQPGNHEVRVCAISQEFVSSFSFYIIVARGTVEPKAYTDTPYVESYAGSSAKFPIEVENTGESDGVVSINVTQLPIGYPWKLSDLSGNILSKVYLKPSEKRRLNLIVEIPPLAEPQTIPFMLEACTQESSSRLNLTLGVLGFYSMSYETQNFYTESTAGSTSGFIIEVKNNGYSFLTNVRPEIINVPDKFKVEYSPEVVPLVKPQEKVVFTLRITTDADINAGDYFISFRVKSDQYSLSTMSLRVFIKQRVEVFFIGIAIAAILLTFLYIIYRRYGRR